MTNIEKIIIGIIILLFVSLGFSIHSCNKEIEEKGGFRQFIIDIGKEIKSIQKEINK